MVEFDQMWFFYFFNIVSPAVHTLLPSVLQHLDSHGYRSSHPDPRKSPQPHHQSNTASQPSVFFHVGEQKVVRWCQIRGPWRVINQFKATVTVTHSSHCNHRLVCRSTVLVKQDSLCQFSRPINVLSLALLFRVLNYLSSVGLYLEGYHAVNIRKG